MITQFDHNTDTNFSKIAQARNEILALCHTHQRVGDTEIDSILTHNEIPLSVKDLQISNTDRS